ncbi:hypothetical protein DLAC_01718 [Tieghemostelium lacteum]|uniref:Uncharacterized protein n=1 Tax=Tieghemostelium lacteum TaxID=361077 RepID=A0A152A646_TIELA|nr:hypothetical protein DLAC_01718 [Tieghemostelium lacteum]|eukprot:KYR01709.1 hypothetical protein DLAC_01718 [Tieghemostelium lacteum]
MTTLRSINDIIKEINTFETNLKQSINFLTCQNKPLLVKDVAILFEKFNSNTELLMDVRKWATHESLPKRKLGIYTLIKTTSLLSYDEQSMAKLFNDSQNDEFLCDILKYGCTKRDYSIITYLTRSSSKTCTDEFKDKIISVLKMIHEMLMENSVNIEIMQKVVDLVRVNKSTSTSEIYYQMLKSTIQCHQTVDFYRDKSYFFQQNVLEDDHFNQIVTQFKDKLFSVNLVNLKFLSEIIPEDYLSSEIQSLYTNISLDNDDCYISFNRVLKEIRKYYPEHIKKHNNLIISFITKQLKSYQTLSNQVDNFDIKSIEIFKELVRNLTFSTRDMVPFFREPNDKASYLPTSFQELSISKYLILLLLLNHQNIKVIPVFNNLTTLIKNSVLESYDISKSPAALLHHNKLPSLFVRLNMITHVLIKLEMFHHKVMEQGIRVLVESFECIASLLYFDFREILFTESVFCLFDNIIDLFGKFSYYWSKEVTPLLLRFLDILLQKSFYTNAHLSIKIATKYYQQINFEYLSDFEKEELFVNYKGIIIRYDLGTEDYYQLVKVSTRVINKVLNGQYSLEFTKLFCENHMTHYFKKIQSLDYQHHQGHKRCYLLIIMSLIRLTRKVQGQFLDEGRANSLLLSLLSSVDYSVAKGKDYFSILHSLSLKSHIPSRLEQVCLKVHNFDSQMVLDYRLKLDLYLRSLRESIYFNIQYLYTAIVDYLNYRLDLEFFVKTCIKYQMEMLLFIFHKLIIFYANEKVINNLITIFSKNNHLKFTKELIAKRILSFSIPTQQIINKKLLKSAFK